MRKKSLLVVVSLLFALSIAVIPAQAAAPSIVLNGQTLHCDTPPMIEDGNILVPMRAVFEALGDQVNWNYTTRTVTAAMCKCTTLEVVIGGDVKVDGHKKDTNVQAKIYNSTTMIPLHLVSEAPGTNVDWNPDTQTITITTATETTTPDYPAIETDTSGDTVVEEEEGVETETPDETVVEDEEGTETDTPDETVEEDEEGTEEDSNTLNN